MNDQILTTKMMPMFIEVKSDKTQFPEHFKEKVVFALARFCVKVFEIWQSFLDFDV